MVWILSTSDIGRSLLVLNEIRGVENEVEQP
jgi:hypothetical protein